MCVCVCAAPAVCNYTHKAGQVLELPKLFDQHALHPLSAQLGVEEHEMEREVRADQARHGGVAWHDFTSFIGKLFADSNANLSINSERLFMIANHSHVIRPQNAFPECRAPATPSQPASLPVKYPARNPRADFRVETTTPLGSSLSLSPPPSPSRSLSLQLLCRQFARLLHNLHNSVQHGATR